MTGKNWFRFRIVLTSRLVFSFEIGALPIFVWIVIIVANSISLFMHSQSTCKKFDYIESIIIGHQHRDKRFFPDWCVPAARTPPSHTTTRASASISYQIIFTSTKMEAREKNERLVAKWSGIKSKLMERMNTSASTRLIKFTFRRMENERKPSRLCLVDIPNTSVLLLFFCLFYFFFLFAFNVHWREQSNENATQFQSTWCELLLFRCSIESHVADCAFRSDRCK